MKHILRYGTHADQKFFKDCSGCYDMIAINANMIAFSPKALAIFVGKKTINKPFFIDPITHLFQHSQSFISNDSGEIKKSISNLIKAYANDLTLLNDIEDIKEKYLLLKEALKQTEPQIDTLKKFTQNVLEYQTNFLTEKKADSYKKFIDWAREKGSTINNFCDTPDFLVAPYFYLTESADWLDKNIQFINIAKEINHLNKNVFAQIVISKKLIDRPGATMGESMLQNIINKYKNSLADGFLVWVDDYSEQDELAESLKKYLNEILKPLKSTGKMVYSLYGGYLSTLFTHNEITALDGVSHGMEYGESRAVVPVGGGIPVAKFYFLPLHKRLNLREMIDLLTGLKIKNRNDFFEKICDCPMCKKAIKSDDVLDDFQEAYGQTKPSIVKRGNKLVTMSFSTSETKSRSLEHYLYSKKKELDSVKNKTINELLLELESAHDEYKNYFDVDGIEYLMEWKEVLRTEEAPTSLTNE